MVKKIFLETVYDKNDDVKTEVKVTSDWNGLHFCIAQAQDGEINVIELTEKELALLKRALATTV